jgi:hypothetical protein
MRKHFSLTLDANKENIIMKYGDKQKVIPRAKYKQEQFEGIKQAFEKCNPPIFIGEDKYTFRYHGDITLLRNGVRVSSISDCNNLDILYDIIEKISIMGWSDYLKSFIPKVIPPQMPDLSNVQSYSDLVYMFKIEIERSPRYNDDTWRFKYKIDNYTMYSEWDDRFYNDYEKRKEVITTFFESVILRRPLVKPIPSFIIG